MSFLVDSTRTVWGTDKLVTPIPLSELRARGVMVVGFETIEVSDKDRFLSPCFGH